MQPDLDRHRVRKQTCGAQPARDQAGITEQDRRKLISRDKISFEGVFDGDRLGLPIRLYRPVVAGVRQVHQSVGMGLADHLGQLIERAALQISNRVNADPVQLGLCDGPNPWDDADLHRS